MSADTVNLPRPLPPDIAAWGLRVLAEDNPFRHIGDVLYPLLYTHYVPVFQAIPTPVQLTAVDLAVVVAFQTIEGLTAGRAAERLRADLSWKYALHLPLDHAGCTGRDLKTFCKRIAVHRPTLSPHLDALVLAVRQPFLGIAGSATI
jgi:hypothetical protein